MGGGDGRSRYEGAEIGKSIFARRFRRGEEMDSLWTKCYWTAVFTVNVSDHYSALYQLYIFVNYTQDTHLTL